MPRQRIALGLEYDGSSFEGWQTQVHGRTVQDVLEQALACFADEPLATVCAGRTDTGVHARGQVVHFDTTRERTLQSWVRGVNRYLPAQVAVRWASGVPEHFHARFSAHARHYEYWIVNDAVRSPLLDRRAGWVFRPLDAAAMQAAANLLLGTHDFTSFRSAQCQAATPVRTLTRCEVAVAAAPLLPVSSHQTSHLSSQFSSPTSSPSSSPPSSSLLCLQFTANAFLHHMVRNIVGALVEVGLGRRDAAWVGEVLAARDRSRSAATFDASGLYFAGVEYDPAFGLPPDGQSLLTP